MATIHHQVEHLDFGPEGIMPGDSKWLQWVGDQFKDCTVSLKADPMTEVPSAPTAHHTTVVTVGPIYVTSIPIHGGGTFFLGNETWVGASFTNAGSNPIKSLRVCLTRINA